jgi:hypothetical protein
LDGDRLIEGTVFGMLVDGLKVGLEDVGLLEGTAGGMRVNGLKVGLDEVGLLDGTTVMMPVEGTEEVGVVVGAQAGKE